LFVCLSDCLLLLLLLLLLLPLLLQLLMLLLPSSVTGQQSAPLRRLSWGHYCARAQQR
jgi:hypothetical protein